MRETTGSSSLERKACKSEAIDSKKARGREEKKGEKEEEVGERQGPQWPGVDQWFPMGPLGTHFS